MVTTERGDVDLKPSRQTAWVGWIVFAAAVMIISGVFDIIWGIVGLVRDEVFVAGPNGNVVNLDYTTWGWITLILGAVMVLVGLGLFAGALVARILAVILAMLSAVGNLLVIGAYPIWSVVVITLDVLVIWAITVHGKELREDVSPS